MPRPRKCRRVCNLPENRGFNPEIEGERPVMVLNVDEYETLRLIDKEGLSQEQCGVYMDVARATVQQIYQSARKKVAEALVDGLPIRIIGGQYRLCSGAEESGCCGKCCRRTVQLPKEKEEHPMRVMIPLDEDQKSVCPVFARAPYFLCGDENGAQVLENPAVSAQGGAGLQAAQFVVDQDAQALVTMRCGQNAADIFAAAQIKIYEADRAKDAAGNLSACLEGVLAELTHFHAGYHGIR